MIWCFKLLLEQSNIFVFHGSSPFCPLLILANLFAVSKLTTSAAFHIWSPPTLNMRRICFCVFVLIYYFLNFMPSLKEHFPLFISHPPLFLSALINFTKDIFNISLVFSKLPNDCFLSFRYSSKNFLCNPWFRSKKKSYLISNTSIIIYFDHFRVLHFCSCNSLIKLRTLIPLIFFFISFILPLRLYHISYGDFRTMLLVKMLVQIVVNKHCFCLWTSSSSILSVL